MPNCSRPPSACTPPGSRHDVEVMEFVIRNRDGHDWPAIRNDRVAAVLTPNGWDCAAIAGWGNHRMRCCDAEIAFAAEDVGWQVSIEGLMPPEVAEQS